jgi:hypothetical protein
MKQAEETLVEENWRLFCHAQGYVHIYRLADARGYYHNTNGDCRLKREYLDLDLKFRIYPGRDLVLLAFKTQEALAEWVLTHG